jgi:hypothetical protein
LKFLITSRHGFINLSFYGMNKWRLSQITFPI